MGLVVMPWCNGHMDRRVGRMQPAARDEPQRAVGWRVVSQVDFDVVIACDSLILTATKCVEILAVKIVKSRGHVISLIVGCAGDGMRWCNTGNCELDWRDREAFVGEDFCAYGMVDGHEGERVVVVGLPKLSGDAEIVEAIVRGELIMADFVPLFRCSYTGGSEIIDAQSNSG